MSVKVYPGKFIEYHKDTIEIGVGLYRKNDKIHASVVGYLEKSIEKGKIIMKVSSKQVEYSPSFGDEVYTKVVKVTKNVAVVEIVATKEKILRKPISAFIKAENVKQDFKDFEMSDCFRPTDIVLASIISVDSSNAVYLSTQNEKHGVVFAKCEISKQLMMPKSLSEMLSFVIKRTEKRKVAVPDFINI